MRCPNCGRPEMRQVAADVEENRFWSLAFMGVGLGSLAIVLVAGDADFSVARLSTIALVLILIGAGLLAISRWRRRRTSYRCPSCGHRER
jgi:hypothetical protein